MKNIAILAGAAAIMMSAPAFAASNGVVVNGSVTAQCAVTAMSAVVTVTNSLADTTGFARTNIAGDVATALNGAGVQAWCTGATNGVVISRTAFTRAGAVVDASGFANGVVYDLALTIPGGIRSDTNSTTVDGTADGVGNGPGAGAGVGVGTVDSFGPTGLGVTLSFSTEGTSTSGAITSNAVVDGPTTGFAVNNANRLAAGTDYTSTVTISLTPGT